MAAPPGRRGRGGRRVLEMLLLLLPLLLRDGFGSESGLAGTGRGTAQDAVAAAGAH